MALDVGRRRIGIAFSDPQGTLAIPSKDMVRQHIEADLVALAQLAQQESAEKVLVGIPLSLDGTIGRQAEEVLDFCRKLEKAVDMPVEQWDERFSTLEAERRLKEAGARHLRQRSTDSSAAAIFLQAYLDSLRLRQ